MMTNFTRFWSSYGVALVVICFLFAGCSGCTPGPETKGCGESCDPGFVCEVNRCVQLCNTDSECSSESDRCIKGLCVSTSTLTGCGNKVREGEEECDDGNSNNSDGCLNNCIAAECGDGFIFIGGDEDCDDGSENSDQGTCTSACKVAECGDGLLQEGAEACDDGSNNSNEWSLGQQCNTSCSGYGPYCGDTVVEPTNENCDGEGCPQDESACQDNDSCTTDTYSGSVDECTALCTNTVITACSGGDNCCPAGCTSDDDSDCVPEVGLVGKIYRFDKVQPTTQAGVRVRVVGGDHPLSADSDGVGNYSVNGSFTQSSTVTLQLEWDQTINNGNSNFQVPSSIVTRQLVSTGTQLPIDADLKVVSFEWLAQTAVECGLYPDFTSAAGQSNVNTDFIISSAVVGDLVDSSGSAVAGVPKYALSVELNSGTGSFYNNNTSLICFLEEDGAGGYVGSSKTQSTATGKFVVFKMRNHVTTNLGNGTASVRVVDYSHQVEFQTEQIALGTSNIGYIQLVTTDTMPAVTQVIDFTDDVVPVFTAKGCVGCHTSSQVGGTLFRHNASTQETYPAIWDDTPDNVYQNITGAGKICGSTCDTGVKNDVQNPTNNTFPRLCTDNVECSLLLARPLATDLDPADLDIDGNPLSDPPLKIHPLAGFSDTNDSDYQIFRAWIEQGAYRYSQKVYADDIFPIFSARGCVACHTVGGLGGDALLLSGGSDTVYGTLLNGAQNTTCEGLNPSSDSFPYICGDQPLNSKLFQYFNNTDANGHTNDAFIPPSINIDPNVIDVLVWISEGGFITPP